MNLTDFSCLAHVLPHQAKTRPDAPAIVFEGRVTSYSALAARAGRVAAQLAASGIRPGARVGILSKNSDRLVEVLFGIVMAGGVATPINWRLVPEEVAYIAQHAEMPLVFAEESLLPLLTLARQQDDLQTVLLDRQPGGDSYEAWLAAAPAGMPAPLADGEDVVLQMYTSGTTGRPKGAMLCNRNFEKFTRLDSDHYPVWWQVHPSDISLMAMPLFHIGGLEAVFRVIFSGAQVVLHREFDPGEVLDSINRYRPTILSLVPTALHLILNHPKAKDVDFTCIKSFFYGASPITLGLLQSALGMMNCGFVQCYGLTEATSSIVALPPEDHDPNGTPRMRAAGKPLPGVELRVVDESGADCAPRDVGEVLVRGRLVMKGYWRNEAATAETIDEDGWLHTGDAGFLDEDGYIYIHDRVKDMIISGGENIYPTEVEDAIFGHPSVSEVAVIGVPDDKWGEAVKGVITLKPGASFDEAELIGWARSRIAAYKAPRSITVLPELPKNAAGKLLKTELRRLFREG
jgi:long-chain acyl-CoA synthetase